jgi:nitrate reductase molybdenum cofactor assembly chaperone NarJ/NarW
VNTGGELPDHLAPILRYLGCTTQPLPELVEVLQPALERMTAGLRRAEPDNPYLDLLAAARFQCSAALSQAPA